MSYRKVKERDETQKKQALRCEYRMEFEEVMGLFSTLEPHSSSSFPQHFLSNRFSAITRAFGEKNTQMEDGPFDIKSASLLKSSNYSRVRLHEIT